MSLKDRNFESELQFRTSRSGGKGGQNVNKTETKVELIFRVADSAVLNEKEKQLVLARWQNRINAEGEFLLSSSEDRSQLGNKEKVIAKFYKMLQKALTPEKKRIATKVPKEIKETILKKKKDHGKKKADRSLKTRDFL
ncbi:MAG: alternative ribosome rescue aminoacyl-tRNA hydrolase ArfB [Chitinophagales bacterium]